MNAFARLYTALDETTKTNAKVEALVNYFRSVPAEDAAWAVYFLIGRKPKQAVPAKKLREWAAEIAGIPEWLLGECYDAVGDAAETVALLLPPPKAEETRLLSVMVQEVLLPLRMMEEEQQKRVLLQTWDGMNRNQRFVWNKLISGGFRVGISQQLVTRALAKVGDLEPGTVAHRLMGDWEPSAAFFQNLLNPDGRDTDVSRPYPFCLAHALDETVAGPEALGDRSDWHAEWKWDGIRCQLIQRLEETFLWTRGEELVTERYPELANIGPLLPNGTVLDGEILPFRDGQILPFGELQRRIGRKSVGKKLLREVPVALFAFDLLEFEGKDLRSQPFRARRERLAELVADTNLPSRLVLSPTVGADDWPALKVARESSRDQLAEGLMLKRTNSIYHVGRVRGDWWKWKVAPMTVDAVLTAAQRGSGKRASLYTDYTFSVWNESNQLVPFTKAYSGLTDEEIRRVDAWIRHHMVEKFGPVRTVTPELVFELAFEGIQRSTRHKSGIAVRFPRILRWRLDKRAADADRLETIRALLP